MIISSFLILFHSLNAIVYCYLKMERQVQLLRREWGGAVPFLRSTSVLSQENLLQIVSLHPDVWAVYMNGYCSVISREA